jgi:ATP-binding cassette subfamily C protein CydD
LNPPIESWLQGQRTPLKPSLNRAVALGAAGGVAVIMQAALLAWVLNAAILQDRGLSRTWPALLALLPLFAARALLARAGERAAFAAGAQLRTELRARLLRHLHALGPSWLEGQTSGALANSAVAGIDALEGYYTRWLPNRTLTALLPMLVLAAVFPIDWLSGLVLLLTAPLIPIFMVLIGRGAEDMNQRLWRQLARLSARFLDTLQGLTTLKLFGASRREVQIVAQLSDDYRRHTMRVLRVAFLSSVVLEFLATVGIAVVAVLIGFRLIYGHIAFLPGMLVLLLAPEFYLPLRTLGGHYHARMEAIGAAERIVAVLETPPERPSPSPATDSAREAAAPVQSQPQSGTRTRTPIATLPAATAYRICCERVSFAYEDRAAALDQFDLTLEPGTVTALVGPSGAGKSTVLKLLMGFVAPQSGRILVNDRDLAETDPDSWLAQVAWVPQRAHIFAGTVRDNIALARPRASGDAFEAAARAAGVTDFIDDLPQGYDTPLGERGVGLSGGQIQRIGLARAFLKDAPVLLLDEPSANLDAHTQTRMHAALSRLAQGRTVLLVAHRLATAQLAQRIAVLDRGRVVEQGSHARLMAAQGLYARLAVAAQGH